MKNTPSRPDQSTYLPSRSGSTKTALASAVITGMIGIIAANCGKAAIPEECIEGGGGNIETGGNGGGTTTETNETTTTSATLSCTDEPDTPLNKQATFCESYEGPTQSLFCVTSADCPPPYNECYGLTNVWGPEGICSLPYENNCPGFIDPGSHCYTNTNGEFLNTDLFDNELHCGKPCNPVPEGWACVNGLPSQCSDPLNCYFTTEGEKPHCTVVTINNQSYLGPQEICFNGFTDSQHCGSFEHKCTEDEICQPGVCVSSF